MNEAKSRFQSVLDFIHDTRKYLVDWFAYYCFRLFGFEPKFEQIQNGKYSSYAHQDLDLKKSRAVDDIFTAAKELLQDSNSRQKAIVDKSKTLLTVSSVLFGLTGTLLPNLFAVESLLFKIPFFVALSLLLVVVFLLLVFNSITQYMEISLTPEEVDLDEADFKKSMINSYLRCSSDNDNRTDYLVDLYKVSRFFFLASFLVIALLFTVNLFTPRPTTTAEQVIEHLRCEPELLDLLRGPTGLRGVAGLSGGRGQHGEKGDKGKDGEVDEQKIIQMILQTSKLREEIRDAVDSKWNEKSSAEGHQTGALQ